MMVKYNFLNNCDLVNGKGVRVSLFVSGCEHHCLGCFSKQTWDKDFGSDFTKEVEDSIINALKSDYIEGISILGGDPLATYNRNEIYLLCKRIKEEVPGKTIYIWTGYGSDYVLENLWGFTQIADMIITEKFDEKHSKIEEPEGDYYLRGSSNQKYIIKGKVLTNLPNDIKLTF